MQPNIEQLPVKRDTQQLLQLFDEDETVSSNSGVMVILYFCFAQSLMIQTVPRFSSMHIKR